MIFHSEVRSKLGWLLLDLLVVFLGVYAAFALDNYRQQHQKIQRKEIILQALQKEFSESEKTLAQMLPTVNTIVDSLTQCYENGDMPRLPFMQIEISHRPQYWETMMQMGGLDVLDVDFVLQMEDYHAHVETLQEKATEFENLCIQLILPNADADISEFYNLETKRLKKRYAWYFPTLHNFQAKFVDLNKRTQEIFARINTNQNK